MSASGGGGGGGGGGGVGGALSLMGCVREASPPPQDPANLGEFSVTPNMDIQPKEPKKRRFHPLRGLRKIFRRKSRGAADLNATSSGVEVNDILSRDREEVTLRHPAGRPEESRSRSASELLTDSCDRESVFLRRSGAEEAFAKLRGGPGQLSVSHDSVFPGEVPHTRPLSSLDPLATLERRPSKIYENESKETSSLVTQSHRISLQVLEQIKTVLESRKDVSSTITDSTILHNRSSSKTTYHVEEAQLRTTTTKSSSSLNEFAKHQNESQAKEDLPELESGRLNHRAAMHRITVRPKNRRLPKRMSAQVMSGPSANITTISEGSDTLDSLETSGSIESSPIESRNVTVIRKSSSRLMRTSDIFEELEAKLSSPSALSKSPDSLNNSILQRATNNVESTDDTVREIHSGEIKPVMRKLSNRISKGSDIFAELSSKLPRRRSSINRLSKSPDSLENTWSKSTDSFDRLEETKEVKPALRKSLNLVSKSTDRVSKSSDSLETLNTVNSDDSIERRRSSYEFRGVQRTSRAISKSSESFDILDEVKNNDSKITAEMEQDGMHKGSSASDIVTLPYDISNNSRVMSLSKSSESVDNIEVEQGKLEPKRSSSDLSKRCWRRTQRTTMSSESSDNLELDDELENRRSRKPPKRIPSTSVIDIVQVDNQGNNSEGDRKPPLIRKPSRFQKSSESSELGSTDTLDSEKKNKSSASTETLDSLEKDLDQDGKEEEITDNAVETKERTDPWSGGQVMEPTTLDMEETKPIISDKSYWHQSSDARENIDIHRLLAITTFVTQMTDNGNQRNSVIFPKKKLSSPPTSPAKQEDNKIMFNNLLSSKNDEDLQNMLNGNISEVSTDTKSFKEKLIMFEKLGK
ncbi:uncharacterized protein LOC105684532 isoform X2 [Athalia rosae]|nr:uncharacterized protein LOC105684532 isoform X2 [Athalia rosae]